jgi:hypothetical protein
MAIRFSHLAAERKRFASLASYAAKTANSRGVVAAVLA